MFRLLWLLALLTVVPAAPVADSEASPYAYVAVASTGFPGRCFTSLALVASGYSVLAALLAYRWPPFWAAVLIVGFFFASRLVRLRANSTKHANSRASAQL